MGKPVKKKFFGELSDSGEQIRVEGILDSGTGDEELYIVKQVNPSRFLCTDTATGTRTGYIQLQEAAAANEGEGRIEVTPFGAGAEYARTIQSNNVKTFEGNIYKYKFGVAATVTGEADVDTA